MNRREPRGRFTDIAVPVRHVPELECGGDGTTSADSPVLGVGRDGLALIEDQSDGPRLVLVGKAPPRSSSLRLCHGRHRIPLSEDVHQTVSVPAVQCYPEGYCARCGSS